VTLIYKVSGIAAPVVPIIPLPYNNNIRIIQTPDHVVIHNEMIHDARIIPVDRREHSERVLRPWLGESRGHWHNDTLIVSTKYFNQKHSWWIALSPNMELVERFTRIGHETLTYE